MVRTTAISHGANGSADSPFFTTLNSFFWSFSPAKGWAIGDKLLVLLSSAILIVGNARKTERECCGEFWHKFGVWWWWASCMVFGACNFSRMSTNHHIRPPEHGASSPRAIGIHGAQGCWRFVPQVALLQHGN